MHEPQPEPYATAAEGDALVVTAPDGSAVRPLIATRSASMATFRLDAGQVASAVRHRSVSELWYVVDGRGEMWRRRDGDEATVVELEPGTALSIPLGTAFQFRAAPTAPLHVVGVTMPPWPGDSEALTASGPW